MLRHGDDLGVGRIILTRAGHPIADGQSGYVFPHGQHDTRAAVAECGRGIEPIEYAVQGREYSVFLHSSNDFSSHLRTVERFAEQIFLRHLHGGSFSAGTDQRHAIGNQYLAGRQSRGRNRLDFEDTGPEVLDDLLHREYSIDWFI